MHSSLSRVPSWFFRSRILMNLLSRLLFAQLGTSSGWALEYRWIDLPCWSACHRPRSGDQTFWAIHRESDRSWRKSLDPYAPIRFVCDSIRWKSRYQCPRTAITQKKKKKWLVKLWKCFFWPTGRMCNTAAN